MTSHYHMVGNASLTMTTFSMFKQDDLYLLNNLELYWRDRYHWFLAKGYRLRPRFHPNWIPSWKTDPSLRPSLVEDGVRLGNPAFCDAIRVEDDTHVVLKRLPDTILSFRTQEADILEYFSRPDILSNPRNHSIPCLDILRHPDDAADVVAVMPILREFDSPPFDTIGEALDFIRQILVGFEFLHEHRVAHRDVRANNIMMDAKNLGFDRFHFCQPYKTYDLKRDARAKTTRTMSRPKYYIIDFGFSSRYEEVDMPVLEAPRAASDPSLPELRHRTQLFDPFPIDVYYVGNLIRMEFMDGNPRDALRLDGYLGFEFLRPLTDAMTKKNPNDRPTMTEALAQFESIVSKLKKSTLRSLIKAPHNHGSTVDRIEKNVVARVRHLSRRVKYTVMRKPAIPASVGG